MISIFSCEHINTLQYIPVSIIWYRFTGNFYFIMEQKTVNFSIIKDKIIKTDEVLRKYMHSTENLKKVQLACKELKSKYEQVSQNLNRLELENERISFNLKTVKSENNQIITENNKLKEQILLLEDHYNKHIIESQSTIKKLEDELQMLKELKNFDSLSPVKKEQVCSKESNERIKQLEKDSENYHKLESEYKDVLNKLAICNNELHAKCDLIKRDKATIIQLNENNRCLQTEVQELKNKIKTYVESKPCPIEFEKIKDQLFMKVKELETVEQENKKLSQQLFKASEDLEEVKAKKLILRNNCAQTVESIFTYTNHSYMETKDTITVEHSIEDIMKEMTTLPLILSPLRENEDEINIENNVATCKQHSEDNLAVVKRKNDIILKRQRYRIPFISKEFINFWYNHGVIKKRKKMWRSKVIKKQEQDSILTALEILKRSKINFTISNESLLNWPRCECDSYRKSIIEYPSKIPPKNPSKHHTETLSCDNCNGLSSQMILNRKGDSQLELLGFVNVKKEVVTSHIGLMEYITKYENLNRLQKSLQMKDSSVNPLVHTLAGKSDKISDSCHSKIEEDMEHSDENNISLKKEHLTRSNDLLRKSIDINEPAVLLINSFTKVSETTISYNSNEEEKCDKQNNDSLEVLCSDTLCPVLLSPSNLTTNSHTNSKEVTADMKETNGSCVLKQADNGSIKITANDILSILPLEIETNINEDNIPSCPDSPDSVDQQIDYFLPKVIPLNASSPNRRSQRIMDKQQSPNLDVPNIYSFNKLQTVISDEIVHQSEISNVPDINTCDKLQRIILNEIVDKSEISNVNSKTEIAQENSVREAIVSVKKRGRPPKQTTENSGNDSLLPCNQATHVDKKLTVKKKPISKLKSKILKEVRERRKMYRTKPIMISQEVQLNNSKSYSDTKINQLKLAEVKPDIKAEKKINVVQNILIPSDSSSPVDLLSNRSNYSNPDKIIKNDYSSNDVLTKIMGEMDKNMPKVIPKVQSKALKPSSIQDKEWRKNILDIADIIHRNDSDIVGNHLVSKCGEIIANPTRKEYFSRKLKLLMKKLLTHSSDDDIREDIIMEFKRLKVDTIAQGILYKVSLDVVDKPDINHFPAPLMTRSQRIFLALMLRLEKEKMSNLIDTFLAKAETLLFRVNSGIKVVVPVTRLYVAICRLRGDVNLLRAFCCKAFYSMGDLAVPLLFTVLTSWIEVFPKEADLINYPMTKVLVQIVHLKTCNNDSYNLLPLRSLLHQYYGYPKERWNCDEIFEQLCNDYLRNPSDSANFALKLFCKNKDSKWVSKKINEFFKPLIYKIPAENENFKATVIILLGNICRQFKRNKPEEEIILLDMQRWMEGLLEDNPSGLIAQSVQLILNILSKKRKRKKNTVSKKKKKKMKKTPSLVHVQRCQGSEK